MRCLQSIEAADVGLWDWMDVHAPDQCWSNLYYQLLGYEPDDMSSDLVSLDALVHPSFQALTFAALERSVREGSPLDVEHQLLTQHAGYRWFRTRGNVFFDDHGAVCRMAGTLQDIHEHKLAQKAAAEVHEQLNAIFSLSEDGFVALGADGCVSFSSPAFSKLTGLDAEVVLGLDEAQFLRHILSRVVIPFDVVGLEDLLSSMSKVHEQGTDFADRAVVPTRQTPQRMLELRLQRGKGRVTQMLHVRDVTKEIEVERMKSEFLSTAAHELRTPMTSIYGFVSLLLHTEIKPEKQRHLLERVYRQSEVMIEIINELLDLARIEAGGAADFELESMDLAQLVDGVILDFKCPDGRDAPVVSQSEPCWVFADIKKARQAVLNILSNAYKYSPQGGAVTVHFGRGQWADGGAYSYVEVSDQGMGMSAEDLARIGERFFRADRSGAIQGTGLGVSIVKEIIEIMGGEMVVQSQLGQGTVVTLRFKDAH